MIIAITAFGTRLFFNRLAELHQLQRREEKTSRQNRVHHRPVREAGY